MTRKDRIISLSKEGLTYREIAEQVGVTRQYVYQVLSKCYVDDYQRLTEKDCIYPNLLKWWNEHRMSYVKFFALMGMQYLSSNITRIKLYLSGQRNPRKDYIDKLIGATGLTYEQLFDKDGD